MELTPVKFLLLFLLLAAFGYVLFTCTARLVAWVISRTIGGVVHFRIAGLNGLKEICVDLYKGPVASLTISEIRVCVRKPSGTRDWNIFSWSSKLQLIISDVEVVLRTQRRDKKQHGKKRYKHQPTGRGKWMVVTNLAKYINVSVNDIAIKISESTRLTLEIKELDLDTFRDDAAIFSLGVKVSLAPCILYFGEERRASDGSGIFRLREKFLLIESPTTEANGEFVIFSLEQLVLTGKLDHDREAGVVIKHLEAGSGEAILNVSPELMLQGPVETVSSTDPSEVADGNIPKDECQPDLAARILARKVPEAIDFTLSKFELNFHFEANSPFVRNEIKDVSFRGTKSRPLEGSAGVLSLLEIQMDLGEIHICQGEHDSVVDILKVSVSVSVEFPSQLLRPLRAEIDVKLGGTQFNLHMDRYADLMKLALLKPSKRKRSSMEGSSQTGQKPLVSWSCSISAPEMAVYVYSLDQCPLVQLIPQTSHLYINFIPRQGFVIHAELGELYVNMVEEGRKVSAELLVGAENSSGCLMHVSRVSMDNGVDVERASETLTMMVEAGATEFYIGMVNLQAAIVTMVAIETFLKRFPMKRKDATKEKQHKRGAVVKFHLDQLLFQFDGEMHVEDCVVPDPKKVNFGSQGGVVIITKQEGSLRTATMKSVGHDGTGNSGAQQKLTITLSQIVITLDRSKQTRLLELESGRIIYEEVGVDGKAMVEQALLSLQNVKLVYRPARLANEVLMHSLLSATNVAVYWDPDVHLFFYELSLRLKELLQSHRARAGLKRSRSSKVPTTSPKLKTAYAVDIEQMSFCAELADGVEGTLHIQSIFSEDAAIGMLFENMEVALNKAIVVRSERLQVSRVPALIAQDRDQPDSIHQFWDIIIQGSGVCIIMPYRLPLRAIDDAVEDMWRGLKLAMVAKKSSIIRSSTSEVSKPKSSTFQVHAIKLHIRGITAEIEEEPFQGWLDEHYRLLRQQCRMLLVRERLLEEARLNSRREKEENRQEWKKRWEQLQEQTFQEYKHACKRLIPCKGSGACSSGFQSGFRPSVKRAALMSVSAESLDLTLTQIKGGRVGMIELIRKLDCVKPEMEVPFSRLIGRHAVIAMNSLAVCLRDYTSPMLFASTGNCEGNIIFAQQATCFQKQMIQDVFIGRWRKVEMFRSVSGSTPPYKFYSELPIHLRSAKVCYGVGFEPAFADVSYAFTVALRKYNLSVRTDQVHRPPPVKKEKSLPWWDDMRYYIHGVNSINVSNFEWDFLATTDPYETQNSMHMVASTMLISQAEGSISFHGDNFDMYIASLQGTAAAKRQQQFIHAPIFQLDITMDWNCASEDPRNHYLHAFPNELQAREVVYDPFRSTSLSLVWSFALRAVAFDDEPGHDHRRSRKSQPSQLRPLRSFSRLDIPFMNLCAQDLIWMFKWWNLYFSPPHKLRSFSRWPKFGLARVPRSGNLSLDKVMTEFILRVDATPASIRHFSFSDDDPAEGLTFSMQKLRYELCYSRGLQKYTFDAKRDILDLVYQGLDIHLLKTKLKRFPDDENNYDILERSAKVKQIFEGVRGNAGPKVDKLKEDGFLLSTDCFTMRKQSPKADPSRLSSWRDNVQIRGSDHYKLSESENSDPTCSDPSDDDGFNVVLADNCLRVSLYGLKLFWTIPNRDAVWAWVGSISKAFEAPKPSPSRQYAQRKLMEEKQKGTLFDEQGGVIKSGNAASSHDPLSSKMKADVEEEGTLQFMVNVIQPQFNLHSEDAHGRFLLAAASGRVLARSFHSIIYVGFEVIEQALGAGVVPSQGSLPELSWKRRELSVLLEHVQAHVAPTDVDPGAGIQWLPRIPKGALEVKRTGALLERVFLPCSMYFQYIRHKGGTTDCKVKPLKELSFNSPNITATMTSRQFHIMVDVLSSLLFATLPKPRKHEGEEDIEEATDEVVPDGVEEVELARIKLEQAERDVNLMLDDLRIVKLRVRAAAADGTASPDQFSSGESPENSALTKASALVRKLELDLASKRKARKTAYAQVRVALQKAAQQRLMEKEKSKSPSAAMRISWAIDKVVWSMLSYGETFAEAEISGMILNVDRDFSDIGVARFTIKSFFVKNCLQHAKSDMVLSAWNPPAEWGRNVMLRVDARQGAPKEGLSLLELFQVEIYPLKIHLTETMYTMMWDYFFPGDEQDAQKRQEVWKGSTNSTKRSRKGAPPDAGQVKEPASRSSAPGTPPTLHGLLLPHRDPNRLDFALTAQALASSKPQSRSLHHHHHRCQSLDKAWEELEPDSLSSELVLYPNAVSLVRSSTAPPSDDILAALAASNTSVEVDVTKTKDNRKSRTAKEDKKNRRVFLEIHNIKISQVELLVTYEGSKFPVNELRLLMDTFTRTEFRGSWRRLFSRVKKHIIWGVLKSVTGMQGKKFKDKMQAQGNVPFQDSDYNSSDSSRNRSRVHMLPNFQKHGDRAGEGFVSSIRGLFNSQRRKTKALVRTMRVEAHMEHQHMEWSDGDSRILRSKSNKLLRRHSRKQRVSRSKGVMLLGDRYCSSPRASPPYHSDAESSSGSSTYEDFET